MSYSSYPMKNGSFPLKPDLKKEINLQKDIAVFSYTEKYFHMFFEMIPKILFLKEVNPATFFVFVCDNKNDYDEETKLFYSWKSNIGNHREDHFKTFLDRSSIKYICTYKDSDFFKNMVARSAYVFYDLIKNTHLDRWSNDFYKFPSSIIYFPSSTQTTKTLLPFIKYLKDIDQSKINSFRSIYVSRKNFPSRKLIEEEKLEDFMISCGYEIYCFEDMNIFDQIKLVKECKRIIILNGSSAANCVLANEETEIISFNNGAEIVDVYSAACKQYNISYNLIEMPNNEASWVINYIKENNLDKPL